jgi:chromosome segregation ATPase
MTKKGSARGGRGKQKEKTLLTSTSYCNKSNKEKILTDENLKRLLWTLNDEVSKFDAEYEDKLDLINEVLNEKLNRRARLYEGIETEAMDLKDIAPRLKSLNQEIDALQTQKDELKNKREKEIQISTSEESLRPYVDDLRQTLMEGSILERRSFLRSFITKITVDYPQATLEYTVPLPVKTKDRTSTTEVLSLKQNGVPNRPPSEFWISYIFN